MVETGSGRGIGFRIAVCVLAWLACSIPTMAAPPDDVPLPEVNIVKKDGYKDEVEQLRRRALAHLRSIQRKAENIDSNEAKRFRLEFMPTLTEPERIIVDLIDIAGGRTAIIAVTATSIYIHKSASPDSPRTGVARQGESYIVCDTRSGPSLPAKVIRDTKWYEITTTVCALSEGWIASEEGTEGSDIRHSLVTKKMVRASKFAKIADEMEAMGLHEDADRYRRRRRKMLWNGDDAIVPELPWQAMLINCAGSTTAELTVGYAAKGVVGRLSDKERIIVLAKAAGAILGGVAYQVAVDQDVAMQLATSIVAAVMIGFVSFPLDAVGSTALCLMMTDRSAGNKTSSSQSR